MKMRLQTNAIFKGTCRTEVRSVQQGHSPLNASPKLRKFFLSTSLLFISAFASANGLEPSFSDVNPANWADTVITGTVTNQQGEPLMGVNVTVSGAKRGYITDARGQYAIKAGDNNTLNFSYVGYVMKSVEVNGQRVIT